MKKFLLAIDQGTTSSRSIIFSNKAEIVVSNQQEFQQYYPKEAWVEHCPEDIWQSVVTTIKAALAAEKLTAADIAAIGISVQRETTIIWDKKTGKPIYNAIVWQDRRTAAYCQQLIKSGHETTVQAKTGLLIDSYFSATKIHWLLENIPEARKRAEKGELLFGTVDTYLIWKLTAGRVHATDATNASRTLLFNIHTQQWDDELLNLFNIPVSLLPIVKNSSDDFGVTTLFGSAIQIGGSAGDQQCASFGQACFETGSIKSTYGTGAFLMLNTGEKAVVSKNKLLTTIAYRLNNKVTYALEGSIFIAGAAVQWLRDGIYLIKDASETETLVQSVNSTEGVYLVPAFTGLGAPYWDAQARGAILGLTRDSGVAHIVRAALEAVCYQTKDLLTAMEEDSGIKFSSINVDGGMVKNNWLLQFLSDILSINVIRPKVIESSALGAAFLAGLQVGIFKDLEQIKSLWGQDKLFKPAMVAEQQKSLYAGWQNAVQRVL